MFRFEKLDVWQRAVQYAKRIYAATKPFPADERFGLTNQMRRAAVSVSAAEFRTMTSLVFSKLRTGL
jgi:hypothetical protein